MPDVMKTVGRYEILRELGRGGMAKVYLARQTDLDRFVALKELGAFHQDDESFAQRFLRESRVAGSLSHPNVVTVHDFFQHDGTPYIAMEYVERGSLRPWVGKMTLAQIGGVLEGLLAGLTHAEQQGIVHRDLKPENLMVTSEGRIKITDFGIAKARNQMQTGAFLTATGTTVGTPTYMAPEQAMAQEVGPWTDMYSVGVMAFEMFVGRVPFHDSDAPMAILLRHVNEEIPPAHTQNPDVPPAISAWITRCLHKDVSQRMPNAGTAWDEFEGILIDVLGPRWRREARLLGEPGAAIAVDTPVAAPKPLTPAPFDAEQGPGTDSSGWGDGVATPAGPATPPPGPGAVPGPDTLEEHFNQPSAPATPPSQMSVEPTGFLTYGAPAGAPPYQTPPGQQAPPYQTPPGQQAPPYQTPPGQQAPPYQTPPGQQAPPSPTPPGARPGAPGTDEYAPTVMPQSLPGAQAAPPPVKEKRQRNLAPFIVGGALLAAGVGFGVSKSVGGGAEDPATAGRPSTPVDGVVSMRVPANWSRVTSPSPIGGLDLKDAVTVAPGGRAEGEGVMTGRIEDPNIASLLPPAFERTINGTPSARQAVDLGSAKAFKYTGLDSQGFDRELAIYAIPTASGAAAIVCYAPEISTFSAQCEDIAVTAKLTGDATPVTLGPNPEHAARYRSVFDKLNDGVAAGVKDLQAKTPKRQAREAKQVAGVYRKAVKGLKRLDVEEYVDKRLVAGMTGALNRAAKAFDALSSAARKGSRRRYRRAERAIARADKGIRAQLTRFEKAGYQVGK